MDIVEHGVDKRVLINPQASWDNLLNRPTLPKVRYNSTEYWISKGDTVPDEGEIIIFYDAHKINGQYVPDIKVGNGVSYLNNLPFLNGVDMAALAAHINDRSIHVSTEDRSSWNSKMSVSASAENEELIFTLN